jgi:tRNA dimethylallyltransferase
MTKKELEKLYSTPIVVIVGPTASGKSALSIRLAKKYNGEIICADSSTIYKGLDVGTAKPTTEDLQKIAHYGLDLVDPGDAYDVAKFQDYAYSCIKDIEARNKLPIIVGGSGLYIDSVLLRYVFGKPPKLRALTELLSARSQAKLEAKSVQELQEYIIKKGYTMPENKNNKRYLLNTIRRKNQINTSLGLWPKSLVVGLDPGREELERRIVERSHCISQSPGFFAELDLIATSFGFGCPGARGTYYRAFSALDKDRSNLEFCRNQAVENDKKLAKKQRTWLKRNKFVQWFASDDPAIDEVVELFLEKY